MKKLEILLFEGLTEKEYKKIENLNCMRAQMYEKNERIFRAGDKVAEMGVVLQGSVNLETVDISGRKSILANVTAGEVFAEAYELCRERIRTDAVAAEQAEIIFVRMNRLLEEKNADDSWYPKLLKNMLKISAQKNLILADRIFCISSKNIRGRLATYLSGEAIRNRSREFRIPFNRQQMADYLNLDRSALSKELGRMRDEGLLEFHKNYFKLNKMKAGF